MHSTVEKLIHIKDEIKTISSNKFEEATIIAVSKKKTNREYRTINKLWA